MSQTLELCCRGVTSSPNPSKFMANKLNTTGSEIDPATLINPSQPLRDAVATAYALTGGRISTDPARLILWKSFQYGFEPIPNGMRLYKHAFSNGIPRVGDLVVQIYGKIITAAAVTAVKHSGEHLDIEVLYRKTSQDFG